VPLLQVRQKAAWFNWTCQQVFQRV
jgi:hypothetical protein